MLTSLGIWLLETTIACKINTNFSASLLLDFNRALKIIHLSNFWLFTVLTSIWSHYNNICNDHIVLSSLIIFLLARISCKSSIERDFFLEPPTSPTSKLVVSRLLHSIVQYSSETSTIRAKISSFDRPAGTCDSVSMTTPSFAEVIATRQNSLKFNLLVSILYLN